MSLREERCLAVILARLQTVPDIAKVELDPDDENGDQGPFPSIAIIPGDVVPVLDQQQLQNKVSLPVMVRGITKATPTAGNGDLPLSPRTAGYALLGPMLKALWPKNSSAAHVDKLDNNAFRFTYLGHTIYPRDDGGNAPAVYIDCEVEYVLHLNDPDK